MSYIGLPSDVHASPGDRIEQVQANLTAAEDRLWKAYTAAQAAYIELKNTKGTELFQSIEHAYTDAAEETGMELLSEIAKIAQEREYQFGAKGLGDMLFFARFLGTSLTYLEIGEWLAKDITLISRRLELNSRMAELKQAHRAYEVAQFEVNMLLAGQELPVVPSDFVSTEPYQGTSVPSGSETTIVIGGQEWTDPMTGMEFVWIPAGCFQMGSPADEPERDNDEGPVHDVCLDGFWMGKYEVTQAQWQQVMGENPSYFKGQMRPVEQVSWDDAQKFVWKLNMPVGEEKFQLPSEAQWEYAVRAGTRTAYHFGDDYGQLFYYGWFKGNADGETHSVGQLKPNAWGLYDMHGNVWEWCADWYASDYYAGSPQDNPRGPSTGSVRVSWGGSWNNDAARARAADRINYVPGRYGDVGFRVVVGGARVLP